MARKDEKLETDELLESNRQAEDGSDDTSSPGGTEGDDLPSTGLLSFYDRLRERIHRFVADRGGRFGEAAAQILLLAPDVFILLVRLALDRRVPKGTRALFASAIAYYLLPFDVLPEGIVGPAGFLDDLVLGLMILSRSFDPELERIADAHWSGSGRLREILGDAVESGRALLGTDLADRLDEVLARRGVHVAD